MSRHRVCIDARMIDASGIGTYLQGLIAALKARDHLPIDLSLLGDPNKLPKGIGEIRNIRAPIYSVREQIVVPWAFRQTGSALLHSPHYNLPLHDASRTVVTVHDLIHLKFPQFWPSPWARAYASFFFHQVVPRARAILAVSENTKRDLMELLRIPGERISVTPLAVSKDYRPEAAKEPLLPHLKLPDSYFLYVGNLKEFKNVRFLLQVYRRWLEKHLEAPPLVIVGRNFIHGFDREMAATPNVRWLGEVDRKLLPSIYAHAFAFLYPSLYEGFGLPPLEAMACGVPVLCSNRASLPEVVGDAAILCDPLLEEVWMQEMSRLFLDPSWRKRLSEMALQRANVFSWQRMAEQTLDVYLRCLD